MGGGGAHPVEHHDWGGQGAGQGTVRGGDAHEESLPHPDSSVDISGSSL